MVIRIFIDHNIWDIFYKHGIELSEWFPSSKFTLLTTREGTYEVDQTPDNGCTGEIKKYIRQQSKSLKEDVYFSFAEPGNPRPRGGGFGVGRFVTLDELERVQYYHDKYPIKPPRKDSQILHQNEADIALAVRSSKNIVLTRDGKRGPLTDEKSVLVIVLGKEIDDMDTESLMGYIGDKIEKLCQGDLNA